MHIKSTAQVMTKNILRFGNKTWTIIKMRENVWVETRLLDERWFKSSYNSNIFISKLENIYFSDLCKFIHFETGKFFYF